MKIDWLSLFKKNYLAAFFAFLGLLFIGFGVIEYARQPQVQPQSSAIPTRAEAKLLTVDVEGAVINPGIYKLPLEARINGALVAASGFSDDADADWVEKNLNLAEKVLDGAKLYIPRKGENVSETTGAASESSLININSASSKSLESLPGIGPVTAQKIIDSRPYKSVEELSTRKIVSTKVYEEIKDKVTVY